MQTTCSNLLAISVRVASNFLLSMSPAIRAVGAWGVTKRQIVDEFAYASP